MDSLLVALTEAVASIFNFLFSIARIITRVIYSLTSGPYWKRVLITTSVFSVIVGVITFFVII
ncbi:hypothetical protein B7R74_03370 [Yersinia pseudotuberculosis]|uniref:Uncharacterized protein n=2 Tax=Yersinia pseudotuberculosis complex TaxID=1649845 RepID=A0A0T9JX67_YERPU|nr:MULTISPECIES: hypothetical protein [Yersinia pseudotuberculosis complex]PSH23352.1 hypothetical protein B7R74_03370 [Yersinia pseudotuberculosis]CND44393.1 Uncharacterised protein [Yersinia pseudotuberculosis]CRG48934.1 Uncharacterised protein [Yersinia wautersii]SUP81618.1 Uncharacterised protein [Yersinia pseudotuberculosis]